MTIRKITCLFFILTVWGVCRWQGALAQRTNDISSSNNLSQSPRSVTPPMPQATSPVQFFRELLQMNEAEREAALASRSEESRRLILAKIREYEALPENVREERLRVTHLRYFLLPLMRISPEKRGPILEAIPEKDLPLIQRRLAQWDRLSPEMRDEILDHPTAFNWFLRREEPTPPYPARAADVSQIDPRLSRNIVQRQRDYRYFIEFFQLSPIEQAQALKSIDSKDPDRIGGVFQAIQNLPDEERRKCVESYITLARMTPAQREQFKHNLERWRTMSEGERTAWRRLVLNIDRIMPAPASAKSSLDAITPKAQ